jgi:hypothetical protein
LSRQGTRGACRDLVAFALENCLQTCQKVFPPSTGLMMEGGMTKRICWQAALVAGIFLATPSFAEPNYPDRDKPDIDLYALMTGKCSTLKIAGRDYPCRAMGYFHSEKGRANFTVAVDDPTDGSHVVAFSGEYGRRTQPDLYILAVDRMELNSKDRPKADGLPVPAVELSDGSCQQNGNFARLQVSSISCNATDKKGRHYQLKFESDGTPITVRRVRMSAPTIRKDPYQETPVSGPSAPR